MGIKKVKQWEIEEDARTIVRAQEIKANKKTWPRVQKELAKQAAAAQRAALEAGVTKQMRKVFTNA